MNICIIGTGYVGLVTGTCFAEFGNQVYCVDKDIHKITNLKKGILPIYEPGLDVLVNKNVKEGRLLFDTELEDAVHKSLVIFIAVGTPPREDGSADLQHVGEAAKEIARVMNGFKVIVNKSTVPVGSARWVSEIVQLNQSDKIHFSVVSNPEFLREGSAIEDFMRPDRIVIGSNSEEATAIMKDLYAPLYLIETPFVITNPETAELIKYASNAFLATKISFINEVARLCEQINADVHHVAIGMGLDRRIGKKFLHPGPGFGGSCFPKDTKALIRIGKEFGCSMSIVENVIRVNEEQKLLMVRKICNKVGDLQGKVLGILGLSFKPNTDDMREAAAITIIRELQKAGANIKAFDPVAMEEAKKILNNITFCKDEYEVANAADALIFITEWNQFRSLDMDKIKRLLKKPVVVDLRNIYEPGRMMKKGFDYSCVGRPGKEKIK